MIIDRLKNAALYYGLGKRFETGLRFLLENIDGAESLENGISQIDGRDVYLLVRRYDTVKRAEAKTEAHVQYADIQMLKSGKERFGYAPLSDVGPLTEAHPERDVSFYEAEPEFFTLTGDRFVIAFPDDAHCPDCAVDDVPEGVQKLVVKVRVGD